MSIPLNNARRVVVKLGTGTLTEGVGQLSVDRVAVIAKQVHALREKEIEVIIVSSGAIGLGMGKLGLKKRPTDLASLQACAAIGQTILMNTWQECFNPYGYTAAQLLLTRDDVRGRRRHVAVRNSLEKLLQLGVVPVINENDSVSTDEIKFGDNDVLSALVASLSRADLLVILSTIPGLLDLKGTGELIPLVEKIDDRIVNLAGGTTSATAVGGMRSKIEAAKIATQSGCGLFIGSGACPSILPQLLDGTAEGTFFVPSKASLASRKRWIAFFGKNEGDVVIDNGAAEALLQKNSSLLAKGITRIDGNFTAGAVINITDGSGKLLARGLSSFDSAEIKQLLGLSNAQIKELFPDRKRFEIVHRDSLVKV